MQLEKKGVLRECRVKLLGTRYSYDEYAEFFDTELSTLDVPEELILDEPTDSFPTDIDDVPEGEEPGAAGNNEEGEEEGNEDEEEADDDDDWLP